MSQEEVLKVLEKADKPLSRKEIADILKDTGLNKISALINKLLKNKEIKCIKIGRLKAKAKYHSNRSLRIYYV